jgi:hypothetical protein
MITDLGQLSRLEKSHFNIVKDVEQIILDDGKVISPEASGESVQKNLSLLEKFKNAPQEGNPFTFNDLHSQLDVSSDAKSAIKDIYQARMNPSILQEIASGERQLVAKIPFTNTAFSIPFITEMPKWMDTMPATRGLPGAGQTFAQTILDMKNGMGTALDSIDRYLTSSGVMAVGAKVPMNMVMDQASSIALKMRMFATDTARPLFNAAARVFYNDKNYMRLQASQFKDTWYKTFLGEDGKVNGDQLKEVFNLLDTEPQRSDAEIFEKFAGGSPSESQVSRLSEIRADSANIRSKMTSDQLNLADEIKNQNLFWADKAISRGVPFYEINPLEEGNLTSGYVKHMLTKDFIGQYAGDAEKAAKAAQEFVAQKVPGIDGSLLERRLKIPVQQANAMYEQMAGNGIKMFVEDPVAAHLQRIQDLQSQIRNHDLLHTLDDLAVYGEKNVRPKGYIEMDPKEWGQNRFVPKDADGNDLNWYDQFLPNKMKTHLADENNAIYMPEDVATRLKYMMNPMADAPKTGLLAKTASFMQHLFRNSTLFGPGYLGMRMFSHLNTALYSGTDMGRVFDALHVITPSISETEKTFEFANGLNLSKSELFDQAVKDGMMKTGMMSEDKWGQVLENIATVQKERSTLQKSMTVFDHAMGFSMNRAVSEGIDDVGKLAHYMTMLDQGYTFKGAAESAEFWFYNYQMGPNRLPWNSTTAPAKIFNAVVPFSSTGIKTMEQTLTALKEMNVGHLTLPEKVNSVLSGVYVGDPQERRFQAEVIPNWMKNSIHGPMLPGGKELMMEFPWVFHTMQALWSPVNSERNDASSLPVNPILKLAMMGWSASKDWDNSELGDVGAFRSVMNTMAASYLPPLFKHGLAIYQLSHPEGDPLLGVDFRDWYTPKGAVAPTKSEDSATNQKFSNAKEFGEWVEKQYGDNVWMNLFTYGAVSRPNISQSGIDENHQEMYEKREGAVASGLGNYVRSHMRDLTLGISRATALDVDFFSRNSALTKQINDIKFQIKKQTNQNDMKLVAPDILTNKETQENILKSGEADQAELIAKHMALTNKVQALHQYYGQVVADEKNQTGIFRQIFGFEPNKIQFQKDLNAQALDARSNVKNIKSQIISDDDFIK